MRHRAHGHLRRERHAKGRRCAVGACHADERVVGPGRVNPGVHVAGGGRADRDGWRLRDRAS